MAKPHYRAIILILASNNNEIYNNCRRIWKKYMYLDNSFKVFFVYGALSKELEDYDPNSDIIYNDISESYPVLVRKTIRAMQDINNNFSFDFFVRTNLTTFWNFQNLHLHLNDLPKLNCYSGDGPLFHHEGFYYLSGTDTIVSSEMIDSIVNNVHLIHYDMTEDAALGKYFNGHLNAPFLKNRICFFEDITSTDELHKIEERIISSKINSTDHYRVKTLYGNREQIDYFIYILLLRNIYNIII